MARPQLETSLLSWVTAIAPSRIALSETDISREGQDSLIQSLEDLNDGIVLGYILGQVDPGYFRPVASTTSASAKALAENWVLRFNNLKRLYKLLIRYFEDVLNSDTGSLPAPNLQKIAKNDKDQQGELVALVSLVLALSVQSDKRQQYVQQIQTLNEEAQQELMTMSRITSKAGRDEIDDPDDADSEFYSLQQERSRILTEKEALKASHDELVRMNNEIRTERDEALASLASFTKDNVKADSTPSKERADLAARNEIDRLRSELLKTETLLAEAEQTVDKQKRSLDDAASKIAELSSRAEESLRLKDQVDELRHQAERGRKAENVLEKYRKKLEEGADLRRTIKNLEDQNNDLLDRNTALEDQYNKVSAFKGLMETYKAQIDAHENKSAELARENDALRHEVQQVRSRLDASRVEREQESEMLALYVQRVKELEQESTKTAKAGNSTRSAQDPEDDEAFSEVGGAIDDAMSGTTMTDLKIQVRRLKRELAAASVNKAEASRIIVLENLLEDALRMKSKYEQDYLREHREKLTLESRLKALGSGALVDEPEMTLALREQLNTARAALEELHKAHAALSVDHKQQEDALLRARSDLSLVSRDEIEVLDTLRASVSVEKDNLLRDLDAARSALLATEEKVRQQTSQINTLLMDKISLQDGGIDLRERMLSRERDLHTSERQSANNLRGLGIASPDTDVAFLQQENERYLTSLKKTQDKLEKAKLFIKEQDRLYRQSQLQDEKLSLPDEAEQSYASQVASLNDEISRLKINSEELEQFYRLEQQLMLSAWHELGQRQLRLSLGRPMSTASPRVGPSSWLAQQRARVNGRSLVR